MSNLIEMNSQKSNVILHAFDWKYGDITRKANEISKIGYKTVLVSPPMKSLKSTPETAWWQRYQPQDYRVIDNELGNTTDFKNMIAELKVYGLRVYVDVVFNHMANESRKRKDLQYPSAEDIQQYQTNSEYYEKQKLFGDLSKPLFTEDDFLEAFGITDWDNRWEVQNGRLSGGPDDPGLPSLALNKHVIEQQQAYLRALKELGVKGFPH